MGAMFDSFAVMLGREPRMPRRDEMTPAACDLLACQNTAEAKAERKENLTHRVTGRHKWRNRRWAVLIAVNLLFVLSFRFDVQLVEGALTASRVIGFHFADLNSALQVMLAFKTVLINLVIGTSTVLAMWWLLGGRSFCSWVCPYHLVAEWTESLHLWLAGKGWVKDHPLHRGTRTVLYVIFALLAAATGYTVFEFISPVGILSRAFTYGATIAVIWVVLLLLLEVVYSRRMWCRYVCPIGMTYGAVGVVSPLKVTFDAEKCWHGGECRKVCLVPHVLHMTVLGANTDVRMDVGADCTRCGLCIDACPTDALRYEFKGLSKLI